MAKRHGTWRFTGERKADGRPKRFFTGIPARDLAQRDIDLLSDDEYATVEATDLYEKADPPKRDEKRKSDGEADTPAKSGKE